MLLLLHHLPLLKFAFFLHDPALLFFMLLTLLLIAFLFLSMLCFGTGCCFSFFLSSGHFSGVYFARPIVFNTKDLCDMRGGVDAGS